MTRSTTPRKASFPARICSSVATAYTAFCTGVIHASAQVFQGTGLQGGVGHATGLQGISQTNNFRQALTSILIAVLNFLGLIAVITVVIAGFYLVLSLGDEEGKEKAKKTIIYTLLGLAVVLFSRVIVGFITVYIAAKAQ